MSVRVTLFFQAVSGRKTYGWSETHYHVTAPTLDVAEIATKRMVRKRLALCGNGVIFQGARLSDDAVNGDSLIIAPADSPDAGDLVAGTPLAGGDEALDYLDPPNSCLNIRMEASEKRRKTLYLAGIPDSLVRSQGGPHLKSNPAWTRAYGNWVKEMADPAALVWGARFRQTPAGDATVTPKVIVGYTTAAVGPARVGVITALNAVNAVAGDRVQVRKATLVNRGYRGPNGQWIVAERSDNAGTGLSTYYLRSSEGMNIDNIDGMGTFELVKYVAAPYLRAVIVGQATRKRGVGSIVPRGRSSRRAQRV